tara:strand:+ start:155 stop:358 length:204 start_codon:yes stop_codon:yes gene_type:complete
MVEPVELKIQDYLEVLLQSEQIQQFMPQQVAAVEEQDLLFRGEDLPKQDREVLVVEEEFQKLEEPVM